MFVYEVVCDIKKDEEVIQYCIEHQISFKSCGITCQFNGSKEDLKKLHNKFFNKHEFELEAEELTHQEKVILKDLLDRLKNYHMHTLVREGMYTFKELQTISQDELYEYDDYEGLCESIDNISYYLK